LKNKLYLDLTGFRFISSSYMYHQKYHYVNQRRNWMAAQQYCREFYNDLATFESMDDINQLKRPSFMISKVWIGLWDDPTSRKGAMSHDPNSWRWSATGSTSTTGYHNMKSFQIDFHEAAQTCMIIMSDGKWDDESCSSTFHFVCYNGKKKNITWEDAQSYCRANHTDLAVIEEKKENRNVKSVIQGQTGWIGLYRKPWMWSDGSNSSFRNWLKNSPDNLLTDEHCVVEDPDHGWEDRRCSRKIPFICQGGKRHLNSLTLFCLLMCSLTELKDHYFKICLNFPLFLSLDCGHSCKFCNYFN
uniref:C-type lectin domain-containing protein n=1 Tax=Salarias fasciatus TaxID=181472 RepID=A0A672FRA0_SALFA